MSVEVDQLYDTCKVKLRAVTEVSHKLNELDPGNAETYAAEQAVYERRLDGLLKKILFVKLRVAEEKKLRGELLEETGLAGTKSEGVRNVEKTPGIEVASDGVHAVARASWASFLVGLILDESDKAPICAADEPDLPSGHDEPSVRASLKYQEQNIPFCVSPSMEEEFLISCGTLKDVSNVLPLAASVVTFDKLHRSALRDASWMEKKGIPGWMYGYSDRRAKPIPSLTVGTSVWVLDPQSKLWDIPGVIQDVFRNGRTYRIELDNG